jgi:caffeoyl-CoA O-methyltransferase
MASTTTEVVTWEQQANRNGLQKMRHSEVGHKSLLKSDDQMMRGRNQME